MSSSYKGYQRLAACDPDEENEWNKEWEEKKNPYYSNLKEEINDMMIMKEEREKQEKGDILENPKARFVWESLGYGGGGGSGECEDYHEQEELGTLYALRDQSSNPLFCAGLMILEWLRCLGNAVPVDVAMFVSNSKDHDC